MWKAIPDMDAAEVTAALRANDRELARLREKLTNPGRNVGATKSAYNRRRTMRVNLCDRARQLRLQGGIAEVIR